MRKTIIISPSGNLYGSENVLFDFLQCTKTLYTVYIKRKGLFYHKAKNQTKHKINAFNSEKVLYLKLFSAIFFNSSIKTIYVNEAGHIRYIKLLAWIFKNRKFAVHVRIKEDTDKTRLGVLKKNIVLITISEYMNSFLKAKYISNLIYDPYNISQNKPPKKESNNYNISIIGRVTKTKGLDNIFPILNALQKISEQSIILNFWGNYSENDLWFNKFKQKLKKYSKFSINFKGFNKNVDQIYNKTNLVIHLNIVEALGRIVFEAVDYYTPIITFAEGGTGELMKILGLESFTITKKNDWVTKFAKKISAIMDDENYMKQIISAKIIIANKFTPENYTNKIEQILIG